MVDVLLSGYDFQVGYQVNVSTAQEQVTVAILEFFPGHGVKQLHLAEGPAVDVLQGQSPPVHRSHHLGHVGKVPDIFIFASGRWLLHGWHDSFLEL